MVENKEIAENKIEFLAKTYNVFEMDELETIRKTDGYSDFNVEIKDLNGKEVLAIISNFVTKESEYEGSIVKRYKQVFQISEDTFVKIVSADPTDKKLYTQWMLQTFIRMLKNGEDAEAIRFVEEDLHQANTFLTLFDEVKKKKTFKVNSERYSKILNIANPCDINQYKSLSQIYDVVDPFIVRDVSTLEKSLKHYVTIGEAEIVFRDRFCTLYVPRTLAANVVLSSHAGWCTTTPKNGMVESYTSRLRPDGKRSKLYVIIPNTYFTGESSDMYQVHVESGQFHNKSNRDVKNFKTDVLERSEMLTNYFYSEFLPLAKLVNSNITKNKDLKNNLYYNTLKKLGYGNVIIDMLTDFEVSISILDERLKDIDFSRFKMLKYLFLNKTKMNTFPTTIFGLEHVEVLSLPENGITIIPNGIGKMKSLKFINIFNNSITSISEDIQLLDPSNGGKLIRMAVREEDIGFENYKLLRSYLPSVDFYHD